MYFFYIVPLSLQRMYNLIFNIRNLKVKSYFPSEFSPSPVQFSSLLLSLDLSIPLSIDTTLIMIPMFFLEDTQYHYPVFCAHGLRTCSVCTCLVLFIFFLFFSNLASYNELKAYLLLHHKQRLNLSNFKLISVSG